MANSEPNPFRFFDFFVSVPSSGTERSMSPAPLSISFLELDSLRRRSRGYPHLDPLNPIDPQPDDRYEYDMGWCGYGKLWRACFSSFQASLATCSPPMFLWHFSASHRGVKLKDAISTSIDPSNPFPSYQTPTRNQSSVGETYVHLLIIRVQQLFDIRMGLAIHPTRNIYWILLDPIGLCRFATPNHHVPWCTKNLM